MESSTLFSCKGKKCFCSTQLLRFHYQNGNLITTQSGGCKRGFVLCLHVEKNSLLSFKVAPFGLNIMKYFSLRQRLHCRVEGLKLRPLERIFHLVSNPLFCCLSFHTWLLRVVPLFFWLFISEVCSYSLSLNLLEVKPV